MHCEFRPSNFPYISNSRDFLEEAMQVLELQRIFLYFLLYLLYFFLIIFYVSGYVKFVLYCKCFVEVSKPMGFVYVGYGFGLKGVGCFLFYQLDQSSKPLNV